MPEPRIAIVKSDQNKPEQFRGQKLFYVIANYGGVTPYLRLFETRKSRTYYLRNGARWAGRILGIGSVIYH